MDIRQPSWQMKSERCQYCDEGELVFSQCPSCGVVIVICAECGTAYAVHERRRGSEIGDITGATLCHACGGPHHHEFPPATAETIQSLGFSREEYR